MGARTSVFASAVHPSKNDPPMGSAQRSTIIVHRDRSTTRATCDGRLVHAPPSGCRAWSGGAYRGCRFARPPA